jgi:hypothetical protein
MLRRNIDPRAESSKLASLSLIWGIGAAVAYLGLIYRAAVLIENATQVPGLSTSFDEGLVTFVSRSSGTTARSLATVGVAALPIAIIAVLVLALFARVRPTLTVLPVGMLVGAVVGLIGGVSLFLQVVNTSTNRAEFIVALVTIALISLVLRLSRRLRQSYRQNPALVSALVAVVTIVYLFLVNGANIPSILLQDIDVWLALIAFVIVLYSAINMIGFSIRMARGHK